MYKKSCKFNYIYQNKINQNIAKLNLLASISL